MKTLLCLFLFLLSAFSATAQHTRQDTLRGSNGRGRDWWDVVKYDLHVGIDTATQHIYGTVDIGFNVIGKPTDSLQLDLQDSLTIDNVFFVKTTRSGDHERSLIENIEKDGSVWWIKYPFSKNAVGDGHQYVLRVDYRGKPRQAVNPPWDGGVIWSKDTMGKPWVAVACQGLGSSSWWPCKDYQGDEPDSGLTLSIERPNHLTIVGNGKGRSLETSMHLAIASGPHKSKRIEYDIFAVRNPINTYNATFYIGDYAHWHDTLHGEKGVLDLDFYPLKYNEEKARKQWTVAKEMLRCFEYWMGPYPFYEDGYKLVEAPYLGMEHQSAVAYGNQYKMGYLGKDRSGTGVGLSFDYIVIHESGHEWFGNNITAKDVADNWIHEGFTSYTESLFAEWIKGKDSALAYTTGKWALIKNDRPVIGDYGVQDDGSGDKYEKGAAIVHMIRLMMKDDTTFRNLLRGLNRDFYHKTVSSAEIEKYIDDYVGFDLKPFFDQYLRGTAIPTLQWKMDRRNNLRLHWANAQPNFCAPVIISQDGRDMRIIYPNVQNGSDYVIPDFTRKNLSIKAAGLYKIEKQR